MKALLLVFFFPVWTFAAEQILVCKTGTGKSLVEIAVDKDGKTTFKHDSDVCALDMVALRYLPQGVIPHIMMDFEKGTCKEPVMNRPRLKVMIFNGKQPKGTLQWAEKKQVTACSITKLVKEDVATLAK